jgi:hypothetical protein
MDFDEAAEVLRHEAATMEFDEAAVLHAARAGALDDLRSIVVRDRTLVLRAADYLGRSSLCYACLEGHADVVSFLLDMPGVEINHASSKGVSPLSLACMRGHASTVRLMLAAPGIEIDTISHYSKRTPLMLAAMWGREAIARSLVRRGARTHNLPNVMARNQPETMARAQGFTALADYLRDVHAAGGILKYRAEPRLQLLVLRALCLQGCASVVGNRAEEQADIAAAAAAASSTAGAAHDAKRRRLLYEFLFGAAVHRPAVVRDNDNINDSSARAALVPRVVGVPGGTDSGPLRLILEYWWSP